VIPAAGHAPPRDPLSEVHAALSLGAVPAVLPCRDAEKAQLAAFVDKAIRGGESEGCVVWLAWWWEGAGRGRLYMCVCV